MDALEKVTLRLERHRRLFKILGFLIGVLTGAFVVFQIFFLARVLPHGGI